MKSKAETIAEIKQSILSGAQLFAGKTQQEAVDFYVAKGAITQVEADTILKEVQEAQELTKPSSAS
jgi:hypothetical protein